MILRTATLRMTTLLTAAKKPITLIAGFGVWASAAANAQITPGGISMQPANSALAEEVHIFHNWILMPVMTGISALILGLLIWIVLRYNSKANPTPSKFSHNTLIEIIWTGVPVLILLAIALPSFDLLYKEDVTPDGQQVVATGDGQTVDFIFANDFPESRMVRRPKHLQVIIDNGTERRVLKNRADYRVDGFGKTDLVVSLTTPPAVGERVIIRGGRSVDHRGNVTLAPTMTLKVTGYQWGWNYAYPDFGDFEYLSNLLPKDQTTPELYLRAVDNRVVVPVGETVRVTITARDVIHSWALPAFAIKLDAVPGRINETWIKADREGVYYGQCSEICGIKHAFMPIAVEVVSRPAFEAWVDSQRALAGMDPLFDADTVKLAQGDASARSE